MATLAIPYYGTALRLGNVGTMEIKDGIRETIPLPVRCTAMDCNGLLAALAQRPPCLFFPAKIVGKPRNRR
jgi:hypothetical protein